MGEPTSTNGLEIHVDGDCVDLRIREHRQRREGARGTSLDPETTQHPHRCADSEGSRVTQWVNGLPGGETLRRMPSSSGEREMIDGSRA